MEEVKDAGTQEPMDFNSKADEFFASEGKETPAVSSTEEETTEVSEPKTEEPDLEKKGVEGDEEEIPKEFHKHPRWQQLLNRAKAAESKASEAEKIVSEWKELQGTFKSPEFIKTKMKSEGYTDEAINSRLREMGHEVAEPETDVFSMIKKNLGVDPNEWTPEYRQGVKETELLTRMIIKDELSKVIPKTVQPLSEQITDITRKTAAQTLAKDMRDTVSKEGVLDFEKDITPALNAFIDANPKATQQDLRREFDRINHTLSIEVLKHKGKREERAEGKKSLPKTGIAGAPGRVGSDTLKPTGNFLDDAYSFLEHSGFKE